MVGDYLIYNFTWVSQSEGKQVQLEQPACKKTVVRHLKVHLFNLMYTY